MFRYAIALGSNRRHGEHGAPAKVLAAAIETMQAEGLRISAVSPVIGTAAMGPAGRAFANAALLVDTPLDPPALLALLKRIERDYGRRAGRRWGARVLDLDILLWSGGRWPSGPRQAVPGRLQVPHCDLPERAFVLRPLAKVAGGWRHPRSMHTVRQMLARLSRPRRCAGMAIDA
jgi:2-amino-4-hydroxy-6-hydroxymethyldihydropteridine diphosphokinase